MLFDLVIRGAQVLTPDGVVEADVGIEGGKVVEVGGAVGGGREEIGAAGLHLFPGVIDPHVHFNEPGRGDWEGFETGSAALAAGGGTCFFDMPLNSSPPVLDGRSFDEKLAAGLAKSRTDFALWGGLTPDNPEQLEELAERGVIGFKAFMSDSGMEEFRAADDYTLLKGMKVAAKHGLVVAVHAENDAITAGFAAEARRAGRRGIRDYLESRPVVAEVEAIRRAAFLAGEAGAKLHIVHVSSMDGVEEARALAGMGIDITIETCPHYLLLCEEDVERIGARAKCAPPQRLRSSAQAMVTNMAVFEGIDFVASDHSPSPESMKEGEDFFEVWGGIAGVQSTLAAMLTVEPGLSMRYVGKLTATNVAKRFGVEGKGWIAAGMDADLCLVDTEARYRLTREMLLDRHRLSPYVGMEFKGRVLRTWVRGECVFAEGRVCGKVGGKKLVRPVKAS